MGLRCPCCGNRIKDESAVRARGVEIEANKAKMAQVVAIARSRDDRLLTIMANSIGTMSMVEMALGCGFYRADGTPYKSQVQRSLLRLLADKLVFKYRGKYAITRAGLAESKKQATESVAPLSSLAP